MPQRKFLLGLASTLLVTLTGNSSFAFTINLPPPEGRSDAFLRYDEEDYTGEAFLIQPQEIRSGGTRGFRQLLNDFSARYPDRWEFKSAEQDLDRFLPPLTPPKKRGEPRFRGQSKS
ncbi:MAG: hypothetical protein SAJ37_09915 [Oscillatoria sp. PMC 1068.18]|nr:hypothetical protein [Oscillatoria sp. PMC 1076.18]MEC4989052.1 hypothetical protein [Oscillatoria sp. PMC 1068.18]